MTRYAALMLSGVAAVAIASSSTANAETTPLHVQSGTINPFYGTINPFSGTINPFYGNINPFWGTINPFSGTINPFWGTINPFFGDIGISDGITPALGDVGRYWENFGAFWKDTAPLWDDPLKAPELGLKLSEMITQTETLWGAAVNKATGKTFVDGVALPLFARYGVDPNDATTLQKLSSEKRAQFFLDWYDSLMAYAGIDRVDHWMRAVNWTPSITQQQGSGADSIIGLLDATASGDPDIADNLTYNGGGTSTVNGHGVGVASLMVSAHDRAGFMGIAPNAKVVAFNPFDSTGTASWTTVRDGVLALAQNGASVINMSLGVPGYTLHSDWRKVFFDQYVFDATNSKVAFVMAAGNDGSSQTENVTWDKNKNPALIIVGSVDLAGNISSFSNRPGTACLLEGTTCYEQNRIMNIFMVAPGELILLPDGQGGFIRRSGTSFAAPLVSGAITLLHDRWPWLAKHPRETVDIMLRSARDLGDPGVDPVYGRGMLDVTASQSPLSFDNLKFYEMKNGVMTAMSAADVKAGGVKTSWEADGVYFHLIEQIGETHRDFVVPLSSSLVGQTSTLTGASEYFQRFVEQRLKDWVTGTTSFTDVAVSFAPEAAGWQASFAMSSPRFGFDGHAPDVLQSSVRFAHARTGFGFSAGVGDGGMALSGMPGLELTSDYGREGGVNPLLALAAGGSFWSADLPIGRKISVSLGATRQDSSRSAASREERIRFEGVDAFKAHALNLRVAHRPSSNVSLSVAYAKVKEDNGLLGVQSRYRADLGHGADSETITLGASAKLGSGMTLAASATAGRTRTDGRPEQGIATAEGGVLTSAFAIAATKRRVIGSADMLRVSLAQPLHIERGELSYKSVQVVDRRTGELGIVDQRFGIADQSRGLTGELLYAAPILEGAGEAGLFGRAELKPGSTSEERFAVGARLNLGF